ncbi:hypothetical protein ACFSO0_13590 [Brevibacillus sp. GCM10020057]|uniref:hypothetical protein n=1 Tax=Brevibacillus sp. GCM10020057 TaxID=3317327 RepID=UPI00363CEC13
MKLKLAFLLTSLLFMNNISYAAADSREVGNYPSCNAMIPKEFEVFDTGVMDAIDKIDDDLYLLTHYQKAVNPTYALLGKKDRNVVKIDMWQYGPTNASSFGILDKYEDYSGELYLLVYYGVPHSSTKKSV